MSPLVEVAQISAAVPRKSPRAEVVQHRVKQGAAAPRKPPRAEVVQHRVKQGETLFQIAERYGASVQRILQVNGIRHAHFIKAGTMLRIPRI
jgi:nucleoid-associated protein YgaU